MTCGFRYSFAQTLFLVLVLAAFKAPARATLKLCSAAEVANAIQQHTQLTEDLGTPAEQWSVNVRRFYRPLDNGPTLLTSPKHQAYLVRSPTTYQSSWSAEQLLAAIQTSERFFRALELRATGTFSIDELNACPGLVERIQSSRSARRRPPYAVQYWEEGTTGLNYLRFQKPQLIDLAASLEHRAVQFLPEDGDRIPDRRVVANLAAAMGLPGIAPSAEVLAALNAESGDENYSAYFAGFTRWLETIQVPHTLLEQLAEHWLARAALDGGWDMQVNWLIDELGRVTTFDLDAAMPSDDSHLAIVPWRSNPLLVEPAYRVELANDVLISFASNAFLLRFAAADPLLPQIVLAESGSGSEFSRERTVARIRERIIELTQRTRRAQAVRHGMIANP